MAFNAFNERAANVSLSLGIRFTGLPEPVSNGRARCLQVDDLIEERFEAVMQKRAEFIKQFEQDTGMELDATRRDSVAEAEHPNALAKANSGAIQLLLQAWYERLGLEIDGWHKYSDKLTLRAYRKIREILEKGDEEMGIPIEALENKEEYATGMDGLMFWFTGFTVAIDWLAAYGIGAHKIGSGIVRVEVLNCDMRGRCLFPADHIAGQRAWAELSNAWPPEKPCGCYDFKLLMKFIGNSRGLPSAGEVATMKTVAEDLRQTWLAANGGVPLMEGRWPARAEDSNPGVVRIGTEDFEVRYYQEKHGPIADFLVTAIRLEGPFGELL
jgi:hypothetical protein